MKIRLLLILLICTIHAKAAIIDSVTSITIGKYNKFEVGIDLGSGFTNPYDSAVVNMYAIFTAPNGKKYRRNAFWYVPYSVKYN